MVLESQTLSDKRKKKELRVLELYDEGFSYRKIAKEVHLSLRDVAKYVQSASNTAKSQSVRLLWMKSFLNIESMD